MTEDSLKKKAPSVSPHDIRTSDKKGVLGFFERFLRRFKVATQILLIVPLYGLASVVLGLCLLPGIYLVNWTLESFEGAPESIHALALGSALVAAFFLSGFSAMIILPLANRLTVGRLKAWRGSYYSSESVRWYVHNGLLYVLRYSFLEFVTPSPFNIWFYRAMGMKIGKGSIINSTHISDPSLIEMGEKVTIGGSATLVAHYGQAGYLVLAPLKIGNNVTIGLRATVMGGVTIGDNAKILPNSVLLPKTEVPAGEVWGGVPASKIQLKSLAK